MPVKSDLKQMGIATFLYAADQNDQLPFAWWYNASNDDASKNNFQTLLIKYLRNTAFQAGTATTNSDFASSIYGCPRQLALDPADQWHHNGFQTNRHRELA